MTHARLAGQAFCQDTMYVLTRCSRPSQSFQPAQRVVWRYVWGRAERDRPGVAGAVSFVLCGIPGAAAQQASGPAGFRRRDHSRLPRLAAWQLLLVPPRRHRRRGRGGGAVCGAAKRFPRGGEPAAGRATSPPPPLPAGLGPHVAPLPEHTMDVVPLGIHRHRCGLGPAAQRRGLGLYPAQVPACAPGCRAAAAPLALPFTVCPCGCAAAR